MCLVGAGVRANHPAVNAADGRGPVPTIGAIAVASPAESVRVDGDLSDAVWSRASAVADFKQREPNEGAPPTHPTEVRVAFDSSAVYVAVRLMEPETDRLIGMLTRRDESSPSDWVRIAFDSFRDRRTAYEFGVNAAGVKQDRYWFADTNTDPGWDAVWDVGVARGADYWTAEFRIPFSQLRFNPAGGGTFGFAVLRTIAHENETSTWPLLARSASGFVSSFGELTGLVFPSAPRKLEILPYALGQVGASSVAAGNPLTKSPAGSAAFGVDMKYRVAPGLTLTGTVNPDFGQVEADPAVVNLGAFETFFAERRPFFVEGSGNFSFNIDCNDGQCTGLFYSRRIGRSPQRFASAPPGGFAAQPANTTIAGAAKLTGRIGSFSIGVLQALTTREDARLASGASLDITRTPVEPMTSYSVGRLSREFANNSRVSFVLTNTTRRLTDELRFLTGQAVTGGVDADWRLFGGTYSVTGFLAASRVAGDASAIDRLQRSNVHSFQRPDAITLSYDPTRTSLAGTAGSASFNKISGQRTRFQAYAGFKSPGFEINDLGFMQRADEITQSNWFQVRNDRPGRVFRSASVNFNQWAGWNFDRDLRYIGANVNAHWITIDNWQFGGGVSLNGRGLADRLTRGGPSAYTNTSISPWVYLNTDNRKPIIASLNLSGFGDRYRSSSWNVSPSITWRPARALSIGAGFGVNRSLNQSQWVANVTDDGVTHYVFGRIRQTTVSLSARVNYTLTPTLSLQLYAQPFVSAGDYSDFKELVNGRAGRYENRFAPYAYGGNPSFNVRSFRSTNVLRWEYRPGSALFVVWQHGREGFLPSGDFDFSRDFDDIFTSPSTHLFLIKISQWINL
jgi:hypothetical protein